MGLVAGLWVPNYYRIRPSLVVCVILSIVSVAPKEDLNPFQIPSHSLSSIS
jgi:hypothetical protein